MSQEFVMKITEGFAGGDYCINLRDHVVFFTRGGLRVEGELLGYCPEGVVVGCGCAEIWLSSEWIVGAARVHQGGPGDGGSHEACVPPGPSDKKLKLEDSGNKAIERVFCNGTR